MNEQQKSDLANWQAQVALREIVDYGYPVESNTARLIDALGVHRNRSFGAALRLLRDACERIDSMHGMATAVYFRVCRCGIKVGDAIADAMIESPTVEQFVGRDDFGELIRNCDLPWRRAPKPN